MGRTLGDQTGASSCRGKSPDFIFRDMGIISGNDRVWRSAAAGSNYVFPPASLNSAGFILGEMVGDQT